jgi:hypothetical protein
MTKAELEERVAEAMGTRIGECECGTPSFHCDPGGNCECGGCPGCPVWRVHVEPKTRAAIRVVLTAAAEALASRGFLAGADVIRRAIDAAPEDEI